MRFTGFMFSAAIITMACGVLAQSTPDAGPYKVINSVKVGGNGRWDYCYADADGGKLYIPRDNRVTVFDLDTLKSAGEITPTNGVHGVAIDTKFHHGFCSSNPVVMWDTQTLSTIKTIDVQGQPDGILFEPATESVWILSHSSPNVTVINAADGTVKGTIDLGGAPEEGASDGAGHVYIDIEDGNNVAVVDSNAMKVTAHYDLGGQDQRPGGLALDAKNHIIFSYCHTPAICVVLNADTGKILTTLPIGTGVDAAEFNPNTMEAFSSQGDGTLTVIKENSPTDFAVEETVKTKQGARTSTLDTKTNQIYLITADYAPPTTRPNANAAPATQPGQAAAGGRGGRGGRGRGQMVPGSFTILVVGPS
jgi:WD40 repeat protein